MTMSPRPANPDLRISLLDHGVAMLKQHGYHGTGLNDILQAVSVPKGSFYNYFTSKEAFAIEVIDHYIDPFIAQVEAALATPRVDALTALRRYFETLIKELQNNNFEGGCLLGNLMGEIGDTNVSARQALKRAMDRYRDAIKRGLERGQQEGSVRTDKSAKELADLLTNAWQGAMLRMKLERSVKPLRQFVDELLLTYCAS